MDQDLENLTMLHRVATTGKPEGGYNDQAAILEILSMLPAKIAELSASRKVIKAHNL